MMHARARMKGSSCVNSSSLHPAPTLDESRAGPVRHVEQSTDCHLHPDGQKIFRRWIIDLRISLRQGDDGLVSKLCFLDG